jgi:hypothetical protein
MSLEAGPSGYEAIDGRARNEVAEILFSFLRVTLPVFGRQEHRLCCCRTNGTLAPAYYYLYLSAMNAPID